MNKIITLEEYKGTFLEKCYTSEPLDFKKVFDTLNDNFEKSLIDPDLYDKSMSQLDSILEKAKNHKWIKRTGTPGNYKYEYADGDGKDHERAMTDSLNEKVGVKGGDFSENKMKSEKTLSYLSDLLDKKDAKITIHKNNSGDDIVKVNGETAFNLSDKGLLSNEDRKRAMERAYKASSLTGSKHISDMSKEEKHSMAEKMGISGHKEMTEKELSKQLIDKKIDNELKGGEELTEESRVTSEIKKLTGGYAHKTTITDADGEDYNKLIKIVISDKIGDEAISSIIKKVKESKLKGVEKLQANPNMGGGVTIQGFFFEPDEIYKSNIKKSFDENIDILKGEVSDDLIEKGGKKEMIGKITVGKNGKKYKKVAEGKWIEVSESHNKTKKEHESRSNFNLMAFKDLQSTQSEDKNRRDDEMDEHFRDYNNHKQIASKLSDKEHSDEEVGVKGGGGKSSSINSKESGKGIPSAFKQPGFEKLPPTAKRPKGVESPGVKNNIKKSLDENIDILKSQNINEAFGYSNVIVFKKKGKDLKDKVAIKKAILEERYEGVEKELNSLKSKLQEKDIKFTKDEYSGYERPNYNYNEQKEVLNGVMSEVSNETIEQCIFKYNDLAYKCRNLKENIKILKVLEDNLEDSKTYDMTVNQMESLEKAEEIDILKSEDEQSLNRQESLDILKGGKRANIGEIREFGGRKHIKTANGWKFYGQGTGSKAQGHATTHSEKKEEHIVDKLQGGEAPKEKTLKDLQAKIDSSPNGKASLSSLERDRYNKLMGEKEKIPTKSAENKDSKTTRTIEAGVLDADDARKKHNLKSTEIGTLEGKKNYEAGLKDMTIRGRIKTFENTKRLIKDDSYKVKGYQKFKDHEGLLKQISSLEKDYIGTTEIKVGGKNLVVTPDGVLSVDGKKVQVSTGSGFVKLGGGGFSAARGGLYPGGTFDDQLQGINFVFAAQKAIISIAEGKNWKEINDHLNTVNGKRLDAAWGVLKEHLGLK